MPMHGMKKKKGMAKGGTYGTPTRKMKMRGGGMAKNTYGFVGDLKKCLHSS